MDWLALGKRRQDYLEGSLSSGVDDGVDVALLSGGIYEALVTTVGGLVVGIVALFAYNYLVAELDKVGGKMETKTMEFMDMLNEVH